MPSNPPPPQLPTHAQVTPLSYPVFGVDVGTTVDEMFRTLVVSGSHSNMQGGTAQLRDRGRIEKNKNLEQLQPHGVRHHACTVTL